MHEDFGTLRADYTLSERDSLSAAFTIDDGNSVIPLADPLFGSALGLRNQVGSLQHVRILSPTMINTFRVGFSRHNACIHPPPTERPPPQNTAYKRRTIAAPHPLRHSYAY